jgi:hypothetical protein
LGVLQVRITGGGVACVPDGQISGQGLEDLGRKDFVYVAHAPLAGQGLTVGNGDAGAFLPSVLEGIKAQICQFGRLRVAINREDPTVIMKLVFGERKYWEEMRRWLQKFSSKSGRISLGLR